MTPQPSGTPVALVIGADSMIGGELLRRLQAAGRPARGTSRKNVGPNLYLDLAAPPERWEGPAVSVAYFCAAITQLGPCKKDPEGTRKINVEGTLHLARLLANQGAFLVFLSTNLVFDGTRPYRRIDEPTLPQNEYGRQKAEAERGILKLGQAAILRLTKVFRGSYPLFAGWADKLLQGQQTKAFEDMVLAPVPRSCVCTVLEKLGDSRREGIWHLSGDRDISYAEAATLGASVLGVSERLVEAVPMRSVLPNDEPPPRYTTLDVSPLPEELGVTIPTVTETVLEAFRMVLQERGQVKR